MLVGRYFLAVHGEGGRSVPYPQVAEDLIIGAVLLDDVDHMADRVGSTVEGDLRLRGLHHIRLYHGACQWLALAIDLRKVDGGD